MIRLNRVWMNVSVLGAMADLTQWPHCLGRGSVATRRGQDCLL